LAPVATFAVYVALAHVRQEPSILASRAFTSLALITLLTTSALTFIQAIPATIQCFSCFDRVQEYCNLPAELRTSAPESALPAEHPTHRDVDIKLETLPARDDNVQSSLATYAVLFAKQDFSWAQAGPPILRSISLSIRAGRVTLVLGATASGKSTLLQSILGETFELPGGRAERNFVHAAYCSQVPWLQAGTIQENIVGPNLYVPDWYSSVVQACGLAKDFTYLENGDQAQVGSNGDNLSGGQRQRVVSVLTTSHLAFEQQRGLIQQ
jgi:ATP-binding cassette, subfamily C (CFTR/MRP), member 1